MADGRDHPCQKYESLSSNVHTPKFIALQATVASQNHNVKTSALRTKPVPLRRVRKRVKGGPASSRLRKAMICSAASLLPENLNPSARKGLIEISYQPC